MFLIHIDKFFNNFELIYIYKMWWSHPSQVCMTYFQHCLFSLEMSYYFGVGSVKAIIHAFLPDYYITSTTDTVNYIQHRLKNSGCRS